MKKIIFLVLVLSIPMHYACKEKKVTYDDNGTTIQLGVNQILRIELPGNASTGNDWRKMEYNDSVIIRKGKGNYMLSDSDPMMGGGGIYHFKFLAINPGTSTLYMEYGNKYKYENAPIKIFELEIVVLEK